MRSRRLASGTSPGRGALAALLLPGVIGVAWLLLLVQTLPEVDPPRLGAGTDGGEHLALCVVTGLGALSCGWRALAGRRDRLGWALIGSGLAGYAAGFDVNLFVRTGLAPFGVAISDLLSLCLYPLAFSGVLVLSSRQTAGAVGPEGSSLHRQSDPEARRALAAGLDATVVALAFGAVVIALVARRDATLLQGGPERIISVLAYPIGSLGLFAAALAVVALWRWRLTPRWGFLLGAFGALACGDIVYAFQAAGGSFHFGTPLDAIYSGGPALAGVAAWRHPRRGRTAASRSALALSVPGVAVLTAVAVLLSDQYRSLPAAAAFPAGAAIALSVARTAVFMRQEHRFERAQRDALTDELTGLANRRALERTLAPRLAVGQPTALLLIDLDGFKEVNDALGHACGDELLIGIARRIEGLSGALLVARIGGDEFAVVLDHRVAAPAYADQVAACLRHPVLIDGAVVGVGASIGFAASDVGTARVAVGSLEMLRRADVAMYRAKQLRTGVEAWVPALDVGTRERLEFLTVLRAGITDPRQLVLHYQPQYDSSTRALVGAEALARWQHPTRGLLGPGEWLAAAEQAGLLSDLTSRVLERSLAQVRNFAEAGHRVPVSINVTAPDLLDVSFPDRVAAALATHGVAAHLLRLEVTETVAMTDPARVTCALARLRAIGVGLSLDDFGTGLSSLAYLQSLPIDELKIDRSFVSRLTTDRPSAVIVASTIDLAHALGKTVVAEGVEDEATLRALRDAGCDTIQGFLLGRPQPAEQLTVGLVAVA